MKHSYSISIFVVLIGMLIVGVTASICAPKEPTEVFNLSFTTMSPSVPGGWMERTQNAWVKWLERESGGRIKVTWYKGTLTAPAEQYSAVKGGMADIGSQYSQFMAGRLPVNEVTLLPWIVGFPGALQAGLIHMDLYQKFPAVQKEYPDVKLLWFDYGGPTQIQTIERPIHTLEDLKGLNQIEIGPYAIDAMKLLGTVPLTFPPMENYDAMAKGVAKGISVNWDACKVFGYTDLIKYSTMISLTQPGFFYNIMNLNTWNKLPPDLKELFKWENCLKMAKVFNYARDMDDQKGREFMSEKFKKLGLPAIYTLPDSEKQRWMAITMPVRETWLKKIEAVGAPGKAILDETLKLTEKYKWDPRLAKECEKLLLEWEGLGH